MKGKVSGQSREAKVRVAEDQGGKLPGGQRPSGPRAKTASSPQESPESPREKEQVLSSEDVYSWWDRRKKLHID